MLSIYGKMKNKFYWNLQKEFHWQHISFVAGLTHRWTFLLHSPFFQLVLSIGLWVIWHLPLLFFLIWWMNPHFTASLWKKIINKWSQLLEKCNRDYILSNHPKDMKISSYLDISWSFHWDSALFEVTTTLSQEKELT